MTLNDRIKLLKRDLARYGLFASYWVIGKLPYGVVKWISALLVAVGFRLTIRLKTIARDSLKTAFGQEKSPDQIRQIIKDCFRNLGEGMIDLIYFSEHPEQVNAHFSFTGREHIDKALAQGKGIVAVTAHFGNFPLMQLALAQLGYKVNVIIRRARDERIADYVLKVMTRTGVKTIYTMPRMKCVQESIRALRNNEIVFILLDQNFGSDGGVFVEFFGQKAATATGPVVFADRTGAPIIPVFTIRDARGYRVLVEPPVPVEKNDDYQQMLLTNVARITRIIEGYIRQYPHEWGWMHRRWKSRPVENQEIVGQRGVASARSADTTFLSDN